MRQADSVLLAGHRHHPLQFRVARHSLRIPKSGRDAKCKSGPLCCACMPTACDVDHQSPEWDNGFSPGFLRTCCIWSLLTNVWLVWHQESGHAIRIRSYVLCMLSIESNDLSRTLLGPCLDWINLTSHRDVEELAESVTATQRLYLRVFALTPLTPGVHQKLVIRPYNKLWTHVFVIF